ncbi:MAG: plasmid mobilization relaxosome protein MobC [Janthinobacterium lividum]
MTSLAAPYFSLHTSPLVFVFGGRKTAVSQVEAEEMSLVPSTSEPPTTQLVEPKAKRKRKTKSEYAALALLPTEQKEKDKSKGGRPKLEDKEELKCVSSLVSVACHDRLHAAADRLGISVSLAIRWLIDGAGTKRVQQRMGQLTKQGFSEAERKQLRDLAGMSANLNQAAKLANRDGYAGHATELGDLAKKIREQVNAFSK